jgi:hypothetical protein
MAPARNKGGQTSEPSSPMKTESTVATKKEETGYGGRKQELEFGGPIGVSALMIWSHYILIYFWYSNLMLCT